MSERSRNIGIGIFVLGALIAIAILIVKFSETTELFGTGYKVSAAFSKVLGMRDGLEVALAGVSVGRVLRVDLRNRHDPSEGAVVVMEIRDQFMIPSGSTATVVSPLMGQPMVNIVPPAQPTPPVPRDGTAMLQGEQLNPLSQIIDPKTMATLEQTTAQVGQLAAALAPAARDLHELLEKRTIAEVNAAHRAATMPASAPSTQEVTANLYTAVQRLQDVLARIDAIVGDPAVQSNIKEAIANIHAASADAREAAAGFRTFSQQAQQAATKADASLAKLDATLDATHRNIDELGKSLLANSDKMSKMFDNFIMVSHELAEGKGTLGMLLNDPQFYEELLLTVQRLKAAAVDLQVLIRTWQKQGLLGSTR
jgi:phospholipid/cholesterol/gamma-HCH transport system substrate-binding protein